MEYRLKDILQDKGYIRGPFGSSLKRNELKSTGIPVYEQQHAIYATREFRYYIDEEKYNQMKRFTVKPKDLIISCSGTIGKVDLISEKDRIGIISQALLILRVNTSIVLPEYLFYFFKSDYGYNSIISRSMGSVQVNIAKREVIENIKINIPSIKEQEKIVNILSNIDKKIELNNKINDNLQKLINNLYIKYFVKFDRYTGNYKESDFGIIPEDFSIDTFGNVVSFSNGYGWDSKDMIENYPDNSYKVFKMGNINIGGGINKSKTKSWILKDKVKNLEQYISKKGDILMCMTDMKNSGNPLLGHTALIDKDGEFVINQRVGILRCNKEIGYSYIYTMSNMPDFINEIRSRSNSGVQVNLTTKGICDTLVLVPDKNTLSKFEKVAIPLYEQIFNNNNENESLEQLRDSLLPKLMNGQIDLYNIET